MATDHDPISVQEAAETNAQHQRDMDFFHAVAPAAEAAANGPVHVSTSLDSSIATNLGALQFHFIGQKSRDPRYADIMPQNADILMGMGGLVYDYMRRTYPTVSQQVLNIDTWANVISHLPNVTIGRPAQRSYTNRIAGTQVAGDFLRLIANAIITDASPLPEKFSYFLDTNGEMIFAASDDKPSYGVMTCTYQNYLVDNGMGGFFDYSAIVLREVNFLNNFQQLKSSCRSTGPVDIDLRYTEIRSLVQTRRMRPGGPDYENFQALIDPNATAQFAGARNVFNGGDTPQSQIRPTV